MILPYQFILDMTLGDNPCIISSRGINREQIQATGLDCSFGDKAFRVTSSVLPKQNEKIEGILKDKSIYELDLSDGAILERGAIYIIPLRESLNLFKDIVVISSTKSSIGRLDVLTRLLADGCPYDKTYSEYSGPLYLEVIPLSFIIAVKSGFSFNQIRFRQQSDPIYLSETELKIAYSKHNILYDCNDKPIPLEKAAIENGLHFTVDLSRKKTVAFKARENPEAILDLSKKEFYEIQDFWEPIKKPRKGELVLTPNSFYLLSSKERVRIPLEFCSEVVAYDVSSGEFRSHYAGFFDSGFGYGEKGDCLGTAPVFEVRAHNAPFRITDGQVIGKMVFEKMFRVPEVSYGVELRSSYTGTRPKLSKYFKDFDKWV